MSDLTRGDTKTGTRSRGEFAFHVRPPCDTRSGSVCRFPTKRSRARDLISFQSSTTGSWSFSRTGLQAVSLDPRRFARWDRGCCDEEGRSDGGGIGDPEIHALGIGLYDVNGSAARSRWAIYIFRELASRTVAALLMRTVPAISPSPHERDDRGILRHFDLTEGYLVSLQVCVCVCVCVVYKVNLKVK